MLGSGHREKRAVGKAFPPVQIAPLCTASARCSDRGQKYVFSLILLGSERDKYRDGVKEKEGGVLPGWIAERPSDYRKWSSGDGIKTASVFLSKPEEVVIRSTEKWLNRWARHSKP